MKTGCPVIAGNNSSIPEVAGDAAILLNSISEDKIASAIVKLSDFTLRNEFIEKGLIQSGRWLDRVYSYFSHDFF